LLNDYEIRVFDLIEGIGGQGGTRLTCGIIVVEEMDKLAKEGKV